jgi:hypothetical protein
MRFLIGTALSAGGKKESSRGLYTEPRDSDAGEIIKRAEIRLGEMIIAQKKTVGLNRGGGGRDSTGTRKEPVDAAPTLAEAGIDKKLSSNAQKLASFLALLRS